MSSEKDKERLARQSLFSQQEWCNIVTMWSNRERPQSLFAYMYDGSSHNLNGVILASFGFFSESDKTQQQCMLPCQPSLLMRINKSTICGLTVSNWSENTVNVESLQPNKYLYVNLGSSSHVFVIRITCKQKGR